MRNHFRGRKTSREARRQDPDRRSDRGRQNQPVAHAIRSRSRVVYRHRGRRSRRDRSEGSDNPDRRLENRSRSRLSDRWTKSERFRRTLAIREAHFKAVGGWLEGLDQIDTLFVDSLTAISRLSFRHAEQQPEAFSDRTGKKDLRGAYGLHGREMVLWLNQLQHARGLNIVFVGILEYVTDEFNRGIWQLQAEGAKTSRELPGIVDRDHHLSISGFRRRQAAANAAS